MNALPIAFTTLAFPDATLAEATSLGRSWGYAGVELRLIDGQVFDSSISAAERARVKKTIAASRLPIVIVDSMILLTAEDAGPELHRFLELANDWESPLIRVYGGPLNEEPNARRTQMEAATRVLQEAVPLAERLGVAMAIETHDSFSASSVVAELLATVDSKLVGALWDTLHPHRMGERPVEVYQNFGPRVLHVQVKDARRSAEHKGGWQLTPLGEGEVPVREITGLLAARGYQGYISVEWEKYWQPEIEVPEIALPQHLKVLKEWTQTIHPGEKSELAQQGRFAYAAHVISFRADHEVSKASSLCLLKRRTTQDDLPARLHRWLNARLTRGNAEKTQSEDASLTSTSFISLGPNKVCVT